MTRYRRAVLSAAVVALAAGPAAAESPPYSPPQWMLSGYVTGLMDGQSSIYLGQYPYYAGPNGEDLKVVYVHAPLPGGGTITDQSSWYSGGDGWARFTGSSKGYYSLSDDAPTGADAIETYKVILELTDTASGEVGRTEFTGDAYFINGFPGNANGEVVLTGTHAAQFTLGGKQYDLSVRETESESGSYHMAKVTVSTPAETPEPATLALAGIGLAGMAVRRLRRR